MSWWSQTINSLRLNDDEEQRKDDNAPDDDEEEENSSNRAPAGVKEDLSELTKTLTRQFWGVASFLAPPPQSDPDPNPQPDPETASGIRSDLAEIGGRFRSGISKLSSNIAIADFSKIATNLLQLGEEEGEGEGSVSDDVVAFARDISGHPETWLDFPLPDDYEEDADEFEMSDAQQEHALAVERLAPRLAALRMELCPGYMSEGYFWMIYFVLLHPRLSKQDAELLSTPEIVKARALLTQELQNRTRTNAEQNQPLRGSLYSSNATNIQIESIPLETVPLPGPSTSNKYSETDKHPIISSELPVVDKLVIKEGPQHRPKEQNLLSGPSIKVEEKSEDDGDDWLKEEEESSDVGGAGISTIPIENDEDVSFSDLEDDDGDTSTSYKKVTYGSDSSTRESRDWVQLGISSTDSTKDINNVGSEQVSAPNSDTKESSDWLDLEEIDVE